MKSIFKEIFCTLKRADSILLISYLLAFFLIYHTDKDVRILNYMIALASSAVGALVGLLFGIPLSRKDREENTPNSSVFRQNTNLEEISDWLTKILLGVGLSQIPYLSSYLKRAIDYIQNTNEKALTLTIIIFFLIAGFILGYLLTRLGLPEAFDSLEKKLNAKLRQEDENEFNILSQVFLHLSGEKISESGEDIRNILRDSLENAKSTTRINVFYQAHTCRRNHSPFLFPDNPDINIYRMSRTIPIFQALIDTHKETEDAINSGEPIDRYYGELGYALKDQETPDWEQAKYNLEKAIEARRYPTNIKWYEFNLIRCLIKLESQNNVDHFNKIILYLEESVKSNKRLREILNNTFKDKQFNQETNQQKYDIFEWLENKLKNNNQKVKEMLNSWIDNYTDDFNHLRTYMESYPATSSS